MIFQEFTLIFKGDAALDLTRHDGRRSVRCDDGTRAPVEVEQPIRAGTNSLIGCVRSGYEKRSQNPAGFGIAGMSRWP